MTELKENNSNCSICKSDPCTCDNDFGYFGDSKVHEKIRFWTLATICILIVILLIVGAYFYGVKVGSQKVNAEFAPKSQTNTGTIQ